MYTFCGTPYFFPWSWSFFSYVFLIFFLFVGRHRGLPDSVDHAVQLPVTFYLNDPEVSELPHKCAPFHKPGACNYCDIESGAGSASGSSSTRSSEEFADEMSSTKKVSAPSVWSAILG